MVIDGIDQLILTLIENLNQPWKEIQKRSDCE